MLRFRRLPYRRRGRRLLRFGRLPYRRRGRRLLRFLRRPGFLRRLRLFRFLRCPSFLRCLGFRGLLRCLGVLGWLGLHRWLVDSLDRAEQFSERTSSTGTGDIWQLGCALDGARPRSAVCSVDRLDRSVGLLHRGRHLARSRLLRPPLLLVLLSDSHQCQPNLRLRRIDAHQANLLVVVACLEGNLSVGDGAIHIDQQQIPHDDIGERCQRRDRCQPDQPRRDAGAGCADGVRERLQPPPQHPE